MNPLATTTSPVPAWAAMWTLALATFYACKLLTWTHEVAGTRGFRRRLSRPVTLGHAAAYFAGWPGMDPAAFLRRGARVFAPVHRWIAPILRIAVGAALVWIAVPRLLPDAPLLAGWVGMTGLILMLHFGTFDLLSLAWRARGVDALPLMNAPTRAASLADFWGKRWNTAFNHLAARYLFKPLHRRLGARGATLATFFASGLVHDLVISVPADAGYGLPTLYFVLQGVGLLVERAAVPRAFRRPFAWLVVLAPLPWLFHEPFVVRVILPFLEVIR